MKFGATTMKRKIEEKSANELFILGLTAKDPEEKVRYCTKFLEIEPKAAAFMWRYKWEALCDLGRYEEAIACCDKALEIDPKNADAWINKGVALDHLERYEKTIWCWDKALEIDPMNALAWYNKSYVLDHLGRYEEAIECCDKALEIDPKNVGAWINKGVALGHLERYEETIWCWDKALEIDPKDALAWSNKGDTFLHLGRYEEAIECCDNALGIDPKNAAAWNNKGDALDHLGRYEGAIRCYDQALGIDPKNADAWANRGVSISLGKLGDPRVVEPLIKELGDENGNVRGGATLSLGKLGDLRAVEPLIKTLDDENETVRIGAVNALGRIGEPAIEPLIKAFGDENSLGDENETVFECTANALGRIGELVVEPLIKALGDENETVRLGAVFVLGKLGDPRAVEPLIGRTLGDENEKVRMCAAILLAEIGDEDVVKLLIKALRDENETVLGCAVNALGQIGEPAVEPLIKALVDGDDWRTRSGAAISLGWIGDIRAIPALEKATNDSNKAVREVAIKVLDMIKSSDVYKDYLKGKIKPKITLNFPQMVFQPNNWKRIDIAITNTGSMHAKDISIEPSGDIEFRRIPTIPQLNINETETIAIAMKPTVTGDVPIDVTLTYKDAIDRDYTSSEEVWVSVADPTSTPEQNQPPTAPATHFTTLRTVWDPSSKDFVWGAGKPDEYGELPRIKRWIEGNNPNIYWFLLKIVNSTDHPVTGWNVTLYTEQALTITEAHIDERPVHIVKSDFDTDSNRNVCVVAIPPELGVSIPANGGRRSMYFKMDIRCEDALNMEFGVSGVVKLGKSSQMEVPIKEKRFTYACKYGDFRNMYYGSIDALASMAVTNLQESYSLEIVQNFTNSFRLIREFEKYCNDRYAESEVLIEKLEVVHSSLKAAEPITKDEILPLVEENLAALRLMSGVEAQQKRGIRMCEKLVELLHIATFKIGRGAHHVGMGR